MEAQAPDAEIAILREEPSWLVVAKPAGLHTVAQRESAGASVEGWLRAHRPELAVLEECGLVHRLDLDTSGCLIVAKDADTRARLRDAFSGRGGDVRKHYLALVEGRLAAGAFTLSFASRHKGSAKVSVSPRGEAETIGRCRWLVRGGGTAHAAQGLVTLAEVELLGPGRRHQIRAGLAHLGHPLVGDGLYGARNTAGGVRLHALRVEVDGIATEAPAPVWIVGPASGSRA
ncbi:MAG: RluA family pseudouridine synthase [Phycisphaerales bacterium]